MIRFKSAMLKLAEAQLELSAASNVVFEAHRDVSQQIPDVSTENVRQMNYCGAAYTRERVEIVRERMTQGRQQFVRNDVRRATVGSVGRTNAKFYDPPPPYNPHDPNAHPLTHWYTQPDCTKYLIALPACLYELLYRTAATF